MEKRYLPEDEETEDEDPRFIKLSRQIIRGLLNIGDLDEEELEILDLGCKAGKAKLEKAKLEKAKRERAEREKAERERALREQVEKDNHKYDVPYTELGAGATPTFSIVVKDGPFGVDLRGLHRDLWSGKDFSSWAKKRIKDFIKGEDYEISLPQTGERVYGGQNRIDYAVSIECAKHIAMMENTERGRQVRQYFIECEKALKGLHSPTALALPQNMGEALQLAADLWRQNEALALENTEQANLIEEQAPKVKFVDDFCDSGELFNIRETAKKLRMSQTRFIQTCLDLGIFYREEPRGREKTGRLQPYSRWMLDKDDPKKGVDYLRIVPTEKADGSPTTQTKFTARGQVWVIAKIERDIKKQGQN